MRSYFWKFMMVLMVSISAISCGLLTDEDSLCGVEKRWVSNLGTEPSYESLDVLTGNRIFHFEDVNTPEDICTEEHSKAIFNLTLKDNKMPAGAKATGKAYWNFLFEKTIDLGVYDTHMENIGLKQAFNGEKGWIGLQIIFEFPTQGSLDKDKAWFKEHVLACSIEYIYRESI